MNIEGLRETASQLLASANRLDAELPNAELTRNDLRNWAVMADGQYVGFVDSCTGELQLDSDIQEDQ